MPSLCSLNCANTLRRTSVAYSLSLSYYSQSLVLKGAKDFAIQFSSTVLYFNNLSIEGENVFFVLLSLFALLKDKGQLKEELSEICFFQLFQYFLTHNHFYASSFLNSSTILYEAHVNQYCKHLFTCCIYKMDTKALQQTR